MSMPFDGAQMALQEERVVAAPQDLDQVAGSLFAKALEASGHRRAAHDELRMKRVDEAQERHLFADAREQLRHLERDDPARRVSPRR
jgi:hypothetical protein